MKFKKQVLDEMFKCYSVNSVEIDKKTHLIFAGEGPGECKIYRGNHFDESTKIWSGGGGTMTIVSDPSHEGYFFASKGFYSMVESEESSIYLYRYKNGGYIEEHVCDIPYLHRFDVVVVEDRRFIVGAALHSGKTDKEDWSKPGKLYIGELPMNLDQPIQVELKVLHDSLTMNHGFNRGMWKDKVVDFIATKEGVFAVIPPQKTSKEWEMERIFDFPVSDVAAIDLDGDGELEFALIHPFHGDQFDIMKKIEGEYRSVFTYHKHQDFYHAIYADEFNGKPTFVIGARKEAMDLFIVQYDKSSATYVSTIVEEGAGSSNARIINTDQGDFIASANRQKNEAAIYWC